MDKTLPTYQLIIDDELSSDLQVDYVALVDSPAIEKNFVAFAKELKFAVDQEKQELFGPACLPMFLFTEGITN